MIPDVPSHQSISALLSSIGTKSDYSIEKREGGGNNRGYIVKTAQENFFLKQYFQSANDPRDRLKNEFTFSQFVWGLGLSCIPKPLASLAEQQLGLYQFVDGKKLAADQINDKHIEEACHFIHAINAKGFDNKRLLPLASEAVFSLSEHIALVDRRVQKLIDCKSLDSDLEIFVTTELEPTWRNIKESSIRNTSSASETLPEEFRIVSPSDFGFHNALMQNDGSLIFLDFEYAGIDDPARTVSDFFLQPQVSISREYTAKFISASLPRGYDLLLHRERTELLAPIYKIKWCCIILSVFQPSELQRRSFAISPEAALLQRKEKLKLARSILK